MEIGLAFDLAPDAGLARSAGPDDRDEEYDSATTIEAVAEALGALGHRVRLLGGGRGLVRELLDRPPDLVFNLAEGRGTRSREAHVPAVCELLSVPYTHSDPLTLAVCQDKSVCKRIVSGAGVATPRWQVVEDAEAELALEFPVLAKPLHEGSSIGIRSSSRSTNAVELRADLERLLGDYSQPVLVEEFCPGPELTVGITGDGHEAELLGVMEIAPRQGPIEEFVYSVEVKRESEAADYLVPPRLAPELVAQAAAAALRAYRALGCRDVGRVDLRLGADGVPQFLELNALPGLKPAWSDIVLLAERTGTSYEQLLGRIVSCARERLGL
jgi:D-alanine-D-alanine ligase